MYQLGAHIARSHILFTDPDQPMRRAGKATVQRGPMLQLYKDKLDQLYEREGDAVPGNELVLPSSSFVWFSPRALWAKNIKPAPYVYVVMLGMFQWYSRRVLGLVLLFSILRSSIEAMLMSLSSLVIFSNLRPIDLSAAMCSSTYKWLFGNKLPAKIWVELCFLFKRRATLSVVKFVSWRLPPCKYKVLTGFVTSLIVYRAHRFQPYFVPAPEPVHWAWIFSIVGTVDLSIPLPRPLTVSRSIPRRSDSTRAGEHFELFNTVLLPSGPNLSHLKGYQQVYLK